MALPLLVTLLLIVLTTVSAVFAIAQASVAARRSAWQLRDADWSGEATPVMVATAAQPAWRRIARVLPKDRRCDLLGGESHAAAVQALPYVNREMQASLPGAQRSHTLFHGTWDHRAIEFEEHAELTFGKRIEPFLDDEKFESFAECVTTQPVVQEPPPRVVKLDTFETLVP
jgi:hypothetical protein